MTGIRQRLVDVARGFYRAVALKFMATGRTCDADRNRPGIPAQKVCKLNEGRPNILDKITNGTSIQLIVNTPRGKKGTTDDSYIRKAAIKKHVFRISQLWLLQRQL